MLAYVKICVVIIALSLTQRIFGTLEQIDTVYGENPIKVFYESARESFVHAESCVGYSHFITLESHDKQCTARLATVSCRGQCVSEAIPKFYSKK